MARATACTRIAENIAAASVCRLQGGVSTLGWNGCADICRRHRGCSDPDGRFKRDRTLGVYDEQLRQIDVSRKRIQFLPVNQNLEPFHLRYVSFESTGDGIYSHLFALNPRRRRGG